MQMVILFQKKLEKFCKKLNIEHAASSSYHHHSSGQMEVYVKLVKFTMKKMPW